MYGKDNLMKVNVYKVLSNFFREDFDNIDMVILPYSGDRFLFDRGWVDVRFSKNSISSLGNLKYASFYLGDYSITNYIEIDRIEKVDIENVNSSKHIIYFKGDCINLSRSIISGIDGGCEITPPKYVEFEKFINARVIDDLF
jgi:hypothetical protein